MPVSSKSRDEVWSEAAEKPWDVVVVGGGITGAGVAREVAPWSNLAETARAVLQALRTTLQGERVLAMAHLSHVYPTGASLYFTFFFRLAGDPEATLQRWQTPKSAALEAIVGSGATLSHQHGVGADHLPFMQQEKGEVGLSMFEALRESADPEEMLNPGKLLP